MPKYLCLVLLAVALFSCKKEDRSPATLKEQLTGRWQYGTLFQNNYDAKGILLSADRIGIAIRNVDYFEFRDDDTFTSTQRYTAEATTGTYAVTSTTQLTLKTGGITNPTRVENLNLNSLTLIVAEPKIPNQPYTEYVHTLTR